MCLEHHTTNLPADISDLPENTGQVCLPGDVLRMVFEELNASTPRKLPGLRLVSKQFDALVVPMVYRKIILNKDLVACFEKGLSDQSRLEVARKIRGYSRMIVFRGHNLGPHLNPVVELLKSLRELRFLR